MEVNAGRGVGSEKDHAHLHLEHLDAATINEKLPGIAETAKYLLVSMLQKILSL